MSEFKMATFGSKRKFNPDTNFRSNRVFKRRPARKFRAAAALQRRKPEIKTVDLATTTVTPSTSGSATLLNATVEGVDANQRVGRRINMKSIAIRMWWAHVNNPTAAIANYMRWAIIYDRQPNAAAPNWPDVFTSYTAASATDVTAFAFTNPTNFDRFMVLRTGERSYHPQSTVSAINASVDDTNFVPQVEKYFVKLKELESHYIAGAGAGTIADFRTGSIYLLTLGTAAIANASVNLTFSTRVRYHDS